MYHKRHFCFVSNFLGSHHLWGRRSKLQQNAPFRCLCALPAPSASPPFRSLRAFPRISASVSIPPWRIALTWQFEREEPRGAMLRPRLLSGISRILAGAHTQTTLPFLTGLFHSHPRFYSPGMGSVEPLLISPVLPPSPTLAQIIVCGIISAFSTTGCLYIFFIIIIVCFVNFQRTSFLVD